MDTLDKFLEFELIHIKDYTLTVLTIVSILVIFFITKFILWLINKTLNRKKLNRLDEGTIYALYQLIKYVVWIIAISLMLETIGIEVTLLIAGSAALLVGIGLGLQQTFNDIVSGIILLFEHSVKVGDVLDVDGDVIIIQEIGLRTSKGLNRRDIIILIPNSLITTNKVINWSNQSKNTLFKINVGVAYGSDVDLVLKILKESAIDHPEVNNKKLTEGRFIDFGNSSLDFELLFFSENIFRIERVKSDIRRNINKKFIENNINIPFPQMDLHFRTDMKTIVKKE
ncbi:MAG: mechanosensitive ion channel domain-containing protein [Bacteroidota bacterium]